MDLIIITKYGRAIRFDANSIPQKGRTTAGLKSIQLRGKDQVRAILPIINDSAEIVLVTRFGKVKKILAKSFPIQKRGGIGVIAYQFLDHGELTEETHDEIINAFVG